MVPVRLSARVSRKQAVVQLDPDPGGNPRALNPVEMPLAALSACMVRGIERVVSILKLELLHDEEKKYGTAFNTVVPGTQLAGVLHRKARAA